MIDEQDRRVVATICERLCADMSLEHIGIDYMTELLVRALAAGARHTEMLRDSVPPQGFYRDHWGGLAKLPVLEPELLEQGLAAAKEGKPLSPETRAAMVESFESQIRDQTERDPSPDYLGVGKDWLDAAAELPPTVIPDPSPLGQVPMAVTSPEIRLEALAKALWNFSQTIIPWAQRGDTREGQAHARRCYALARQILNQV